MRKRRGVMRHQSTASKARLTIEGNCMQPPAKKNVRNNLVGRSRQITADFNLRRRHVLLELISLPANLRSVMV